MPLRLLTLACALAALTVGARPAPGQPPDVSGGWSSGPVVSGVSGGARGLPEDVAVGRDTVVGSMEAEWITVRGRGFGSDAVVWLRAPGVDAEIMGERRIRVRSPERLEVSATVGTEADDWTVEVASGGAASGRYPFRVVPPRPVVQRAEVLDGGVRRPAYTVRLVGPAYAETSEVLVDGEPVPTRPVKSSPYSGALTVGLEAAVPASAFEGGRATLRVRTPEAAGSGVSDPVVAALPTVPWHARPEVWLSILGVVLGLGVVAYRGGVRRARMRAENVRLEEEVAERTAELEAQARQLDAARATQAAQAADLRIAAENRARVLAGVTHDLRTPLSVVVASLDGVLGRDGLAEDDRAEVEAARRAADGLVRLSASLGEAARHEAGRFPLSLAPLDVAALARDVVTEQAILLDRLGITVGTGGEHEIWAQADAWAVRRILTNLLDNAGKFTPGGGEVTVELAEAGGRVSLTVRDSGPGFSPDFVRHAFDPFVQSGRGAGSPSREGIGLGLSVVRELAERMGGAVRAEPGPGGRVVVSLPTAEKPAETTAAPAPDSGPGRLLVLVAEDDAELRDVLVRALAEEFEVEAVPDGREALEAARRLRPAVVVSDIVMPELDGVSLVRSLRAEGWGEAIPVVLVTALDAPEQTVDAFEAGADDYVTKPFNRAVLLARVRRLVGGRPETDDGAVVPVGPDGRPLSPEDARLMEAVRAAVEANLSTLDFGVEDLGCEVGLSKAHLTRRMNDALGVPPAKYVERVRLDHAAGLLRAGGRLVKEVAGLVGYREVKTFSRAFQRQYGAPPSRWGDDLA